MSYVTDKMFERIEKQKAEDGTASDLGAVPTGHKEPKEDDSQMHSLCVHDIDEEHGWDDGW